MARFEVMRVPDPKHVPAAVLRRVGDIWGRGGLVAFPTETVYGLGADADNAHACRRIYETKGRPADNPLIVHFASREAAETALGPLPASADRLARAFWPGPLTLVVPRPEGRFKGAAAGLGTVAVRVPDHPVARRLLEATGRAVAAPSANRSGRPSPTLALDVVADLAEAERMGVDLSDVLVLDAGSCILGVESTVVDATEEPVAVLRQGGVPQADLEALLGPVLGSGAKEARRRRSPGTHYRHYAPAAPVWLWEEDEGDDVVREGLRVALEGRNAEAADRSARDRGPVVILASEDRIRRLDGFLRTLPDVAPGPAVFAGGGDADPNSSAYAHGLFTWLREADRMQACAVFAELPSARRGGYSTAVRDRLTRAAGGLHLVSSKGCRGRSAAALDDGGRHA